MADTQDSSDSIETRLGSSEMQRRSTSPFLCLLIHIVIGCYFVYEQLKITNDFLLLISVL